MLTAAASSHTLKTAPQRSPSGRLRNSETLWPWRTKRPPNQSQEQVPWRPERSFWNPTRNLLLSCYRARVLSYPAILLFRNTAETTSKREPVLTKQLLLQASKTYPSPHRNTMPLKAAAACLLLPAAPCCCLLLVQLLVAAAAAVVLLWCCCNQTASKARNKQPDTLFETHPKQQNTT